MYTSSGRKFGLDEKKWGGETKEREQIGRGGNGDEEDTDNK